MRIHVKVKSAWKWCGSATLLLRKLCFLCELYNVSNVADPRHFSTDLVSRIRTYLNNGLGSCYFQSLLTFKVATKNYFCIGFFAYYFLKLHFHHFSRIKSHKEVITEQYELRLFIKFLLVDRRIRSRIRTSYYPIRIQEAQKHMEPIAPDPDPQHCYVCWAGSLFLPEGWRQQLCECSACRQLYEDSGLTFLTSLADTVHHYESQVSLDHRVPTLPPCWVGNKKPTQNTPQKNPLKMFFFLFLGFFKKILIFNFF